MATTTTNFGWDIPQSTDLVKDGATAIAALGQDIDTALVDLKGGTTGQVLAKASNTDLDYSWVAQDDSNAIQNAIVDAKGDLIAATAADTPARLAVGTNGEVLIADSTAATGLKWAKAANFVGAVAYPSAAQTIANATFTTINFNTEDFDTNSFHDNSTNNSRMTIPSGLGGKYRITAYIRFNPNATGRRLISILKNGNGIVSCESAANAVAFLSCFAEGIITASATDYFTITAYQESGGNLDTVPGSDSTRFEIEYLGA
jgi:hypothetical protein